MIVQASVSARARIETYEALAETCLDLSDQRFDFLFDDSRKLLAIGFNVTDNRRDSSFYDLLASECDWRATLRLPKGNSRKSIGLPLAGF